MAKLIELFELFKQLSKRKKIAIGISITSFIVILFIIVPTAVVLTNKANSSRSSGGTSGSTSGNTVTTSTNAPTRAPTKAPTRAPTASPTSAPTISPTPPPATAPPAPIFTHAPTAIPTQAPRACCDLYSVDATGTCPANTVRQDAALCYPTSTGTAKQSCTSGYGSDNGSYCFAGINPECPGGYSWDKQSSCTKLSNPLSCTGMKTTYGIDYHENAGDIVNCWAPPKTIDQNYCTTNYGADYKVSGNSCIKPSYCPDGYSNPVAGVCWKAATLSCTGVGNVGNTYHLVGATCENDKPLTATCPTNGGVTWNANPSICYIAPKACPSGQYPDGNGNCVTSTCPSGYTISSDGKTCSTNTIPITCPSGYTQIGSSCYRAAYNYCPDPTTSAGWTWNWNLLGASGATTSCTAPAASANAYCNKYAKDNGWPGTSTDWNGNGSGCCYNGWRVETRCPASPGYQACPPGSTTSMPNCYVNALGAAADTIYPSICPNDGSTYDIGSNKCIRPSTTSTTKTTACPSDATGFSGGNCTKPLYWSGGDVVKPAPVCTDAGSSYNGNPANPYCGIAEYSQVVKNPPICDSDSQNIGNYCAKPFPAVCNLSESTYLPATDLPAGTDPKIGGWCRLDTWPNYTGPNYSASTACPAGGSWNGIKGAGANCASKTIYTCPDGQEWDGVIGDAKGCKAITWVEPTRTMPVPKTWSCPDLPSGEQCGRDWDTTTVGKCTLGQKCL